MQDPSSFLPEFATDLECAVYPRERARIDSLHCLRLNFESYFVSSEKAKRDFLDDPLAHCGKLTDPVTQLRFTPTPQSPRVEWRGRSFYLSSDSTRALFAALPDSFSVPRLGMIGM